MSYSLFSEGRREQGLRCPCPLSTSGISQRARTSQPLLSRRARTFRLNRLSPVPAAGINQCLHARSNFLANRTHFLEWAILGIGKRPIVALDARNVRALVATTQRDQKRGIAGEVLGKTLRTIPTHVHSDLSHRFDDGRVNAIAWLSPRRHGPCARHICHLVEESRA